MKINVLKNKETLSIEEALDVKGGLNSTFNLAATECICDCILGNTNEETNQTVNIPTNSLH